MDQIEKNYNYAINTLNEALICRTISECSKCPISDKCFTAGVDDPHFSTVLEMAIKALKTAKQLDAAFDKVERVANSGQWNDSVKFGMQHAVWIIKQQMMEEQTNDR